MSKIVKAKWVVHMPTVKKQSNKKEADRASHQEDREPFEDINVKAEKNLNDSGKQIDHQLEAIRMANDLMKSALRSSREIAEKSQEDGFDKGYNEGYQVGYETGFEEGLSHGKKEAKQEVEASLDDIREIAQTIHDDREQAIFQREDEIITFALEIAKKIMRYEIKKDDENFIKIFHEVIHKDDQNVKIYLSEYQKTLDLYLQKATIDKIKNLSQKTKVVLLKEDDKIVVETDEAVIDMAVAVQIDGIQQAIVDNQTDN